MSKGIKKDANIIADIILTTDTELRGNLLLLIGEALRKDTQYFTGNVISSAAYQYGVKPELLKMSDERD